MFPPFATPEKRHDDASFSMQVSGYQIPEADKASGEGSDTKSVENYDPIFAEEEKTEERNDGDIEKSDTKIDQFISSITSSSVQKEKNDIPVNDFSRRMENRPCIVITEED